MFCNVGIIPTIIHRLGVPLGTEEYGNNSIKNNESFTHRHKVYDIDNMIQLDLPPPPPPPPATPTPTPDTRILNSQD